jgi:hypothetical protein
MWPAGGARGREGDQDRGREALHAPGRVAVQVLAEVGDVLAVAAHPYLQPFGDDGQGRLVVRGLAERAQQGGGRRDRGQALALDVPEEDPGAVRAGLDVVEVAADAGLAVGGQVHGRVVEPAPRGGEGAQHGTAGRVGHVPHVQHPALLPDPYGTRQGRQGAAHGDQDEVRQAGLVLVRPGGVDLDVGEEREHGEGGGSPDSADRRRDAGDEDDPGDDPELARGVPVDHRDGDEQEQGGYPGHAAAAYPEKLLPPGAAGRIRATHPPSEARPGA